MLYPPDICAPSHKLATARLCDVAGVETDTYLPSVRNNRKLLRQFAPYTADGSIIRCDQHKTAVTTIHCRSATTIIEMYIVIC
jgi:hypothetical protein